MKKIISLVLVLNICLFYIPHALCQSPSFNVYTNPVIPGDHSDCTLTKIGKDYYTTGSSFNPTPVIYHSTDLVHWEAIAQPVSAAWKGYGDAARAGCWGGQIVYHNGKYWDFFSCGGMHFVTADKPEGPWSMPTRMIKPSTLTKYGLGYDNSVFIDDNNKWYLVVKDLQPNNGILELGDDGQPTGLIYDLNWLNAKKDDGKGYRFGWAEGPVMWKQDGYYYYSFAVDLGGGQKVMRSKTLTADKSAWTEPVNFFNENDPGKSTALFTGPNHSSASVSASDNTNWVLHPLFANANKNEWFGQGRQGLLNQVTFEGDKLPVADYPVNRIFTAPKLPSSGIPWMVPKSDFFTSEKLNPEWSFLGQTDDNLWSLTERPGWFRLKPKSATKANTIIKTDAEHNYSLMTRVDFEPKTKEDEAGLRIMNGWEKMFVKLYSSLNEKGQKIIGFSFEKEYYEAVNTIGNTIWLKIIRSNHILTAYFSADGSNWTQVGSGIDVSSLDSHSVDYNAFTANRQGLYAKGTSADFDLYIYRDAYSTIPAESPANRFDAERVGTKASGFDLGNIHNNGWALYAGVEFGTESYQKTANSIEITAASMAKGASVEVWLDSIGTGKKIAVCKTSSTGSISAFKTFKAKTSPTTGRHDVYLRFVGLKKDNLFVLKSFEFKTN